MHLMMPLLCQTILRSGSTGRCPHHASVHEALSGRDDEGAFKTARGKLYPPGLNAAVARAVVSFIQGTFGLSSAQAMPSDFFDLAANGFVSDDAVQPDFHG